MKAYTNYDREYGNLLWLSNGSVEVAAALDYGLRIMVLPDASSSVWKT